ncbi:JAB domain-containing protein [Variovorax brevis]|uniref:JAB domain-containing protein n=1 Tax=Variovorax brevis TaxID=3053503 RepID=UPI0040382B9E
MPKRALHHHCAAVILAHNHPFHPSGATDPSPPDLVRTRTLRSGPEIVDVQVLDPFIVAGARELAGGARPGVRAPRGSAPWVHSAVRRPPCRRACPRPRQRAGERSAKTKGRAASLGRQARTPFSPSRPARPAGAGGLRPSSRLDRCAAPCARRPRAIPPAKHSRRTR